MSDFNRKMNNMNNTRDFTGRFNRRDVEENKVMAILAYLSWLVLVPLFAAKRSRFARFHCNQGIVLAIAELIVIVVCGILSRIPVIGWLFGIIEGLVGLVCFILAIIGVINAANGRAKELPIVGNFRILK